MQWVASVQEGSGGVVAEAEAEAEAFFMGYGRGTGSEPTACLAGRCGDGTEGLIETRDGVCKDAGWMGELGADILRVGDGKLSRV